MHRYDRTIPLLAFLMLAMLGLCAGPAAARVVPDVPWAKAAREKLPPGQPDTDYTPIHAPDGATLPFRIVDGVKVMHLTIGPIEHEAAPGLTIRTWGYNGRTPGPVIEAVEGDLLRIYVTNNLPVGTVVHWHGMLLPNGMDGVMGLTQPPIPPGETFVYQFYLPEPGTFMYHSHFDTMTQEGMGLTGMFVVHPRNPERRPDRDFVLMLHEWKIEPGAARPDTVEMTDFNVLTINGRALPGTSPLVAELGDTVRIRIGNLSAMDHHPVHLHGYDFKVVETDGGSIPESAQWPETTVLVAVGQTRSIEFVADNPGDWIMHCHMTHHTMNQMGHDIPNMIGVDVDGVDEEIRELLPGYMSMGMTGMTPLQKMGMPVPENAIPMLGAEFQYGVSTMGGMATVLKVREKAEGFADPGDYEMPPGTVSRKATPEELERDGIAIP